MISFEGVTVVRQRANQTPLTILDHVSFAIPTGTRTAIVARSGVGKTTLLRLINRLDDPNSGLIQLDGVDIATIPPPDLRRRVGMLFQQPHLFDASVFENLNRPLQLARRPLLDIQQAEATLRDVDLPPAILNNHSRELSLGQQQRVALARALVLEPEVLLLDEPTSALDERSAEIILQLLVSQQQRRAMTMVMVTHTFGHAATFAEHFIALRAGQVHLTNDLADAREWAFVDDEQPELVTP